MESLYSEKWSQDIQGMSPGILPKTTGQLGGISEFHPSPVIETDNFYLLPFGRLGGSSTGYYSVIDRVSSINKKTGETVNFEIYRGSESHHIVIEDTVLFFEINKSRYAASEITLEWAELDAASSTIKTKSFGLSRIFDELKQNNFIIDGVKWVLISDYSGNEISCGAEYKENGDFVFHYGIVLQNNQTLMFKSVSIKITKDGQLMESGETTTSKILGKEESLYPYIYENIYQIFDFLGSSGRQSDVLSRQRTTGLPTNQPASRIIWSGKQNSIESIQSTVDLGYNTNKLTLNGKYHFIGFTLPGKKPKNKEVQQVRGKFGAWIGVGNREPEPGKDKSLYVIDYTGRVSKQTLDVVTVNNICAIDNNDFIYIATNDALLKIKNNKVVWRTEMNHYISRKETPVIDFRFDSLQESLFIVTAHGVTENSYLTCVDVETGKLRWGYLDSVGNINYKASSYQNPEKMLNTPLALLDLKLDNDEMLEPYVLARINDRFEEERTLNEFVKIDFFYSPADVICRRMPAHPKYLARFKEEDK